MPPGPGRGPSQVRRSEGASDGGLRAPLSRPVDLLWIAGLAIAGIAVAWSIVTTGLADALAVHRPDAALAWRRNSAEALLHHAEAAFEAGRLTDADLAARGALAADPAMTPALRVLGLVADGRGDAARALSVMTVAGARDYRDPAVQFWVMIHAARAGNYGEALARMDALARAEPDLGRRIFPIAMAIAQRPEGTPALAARLALDPPWRAGFMNYWIRNAPTANDPVNLMDSLTVLGDRPTPAEMSQLQARLVRDKRFQQAFAIWAQDLPPDQLNDLADVNDRGFEGAPASGVFVWEIERRARGVADFETAPDRAGRALHLRFDGRPAPPVLVRQLMIVGPGPRILSGEVRADRLVTSEGLVWTVRCAGEDHTVVAQTEPLMASTGWRRFEVRLTVPDSGCEGQWLSLVALGQTDGARRNVGDVWFDNMSIRR